MPAPTRDANEPCPDAETLAAFGDGMLSGEEREMVVNHLSGCDRCRSIVMEVSGGPRPLFYSLARPTSVEKKQKRGWWLVVVIVVAVAFSLTWKSCVSLAEEDKGRDSLGESRPFTYELFSSDDFLHNEGSLQWRLHSPFCLYCIAAGFGASRAIR